MDPEEPGTRTDTDVGAPVARNGAAAGARATNATAGTEPARVGPAPSAAPRAPGKSETTSPGMPPAPPPLRAPHLRPRSRSGSGTFGVRGIRSPLVGRDRELESMVRAVHNALEFKAPLLITVLGNQGTGKTRLVHELLSRVGRAPVRVFWGRAIKGGPRYAAVSALLRERFRTAESDPEPVARAKFKSEVERVFGDSRLADVLHFLGEFVDLGFSDSPFVRVLGENPAQLEEISRTVLRRFLELDAAQGPLIGVFDDLQWADADTLSLIKDLGASVGGSPLVLIALARPELMVRFSDWGAGATDNVRVDLRNLDEERAREMFLHLLSRCEDVPPEIVDDAVEMTGGNPHFLEQLVRLFVANGTIDSAGPRWKIDAEKAAETELPISIEEAIEARIAALEAPERDLLEKGAVFGNVFWAGAVVALARLETHRKRVEADGTDAPPIGGARVPLELDWSNEGEPIRRRVMALIDALVERDYLLRLSVEDSTIPGDTELVFKHNLERELIAKSTDAHRLEQYHRLAAQWFETKLAARSEEQLEFLAQLYERGGDRRRAAHCYLSGADKARSRYANEQAVSLYKRGLAMLDEYDAGAWLEALHNYGSVLDLLGETEAAEEKFVDMLRRAWLFDNRSKGGAAHGRLGRIYRRKGEYDLAMEHFRAAHDLFNQAGDQRGVAGTLDDIGRIHWLRGGYGQALEFHRQALAIRRAVGDRRSIALSLANIGRVHNDSGAFKAANRQFREALDLRRDIGDLSGVVQSLCDLGGVHTADGNYEMALEMFTEAHGIANEIGEKLAQTEVLSGLGECKTMMGRGPEAVEHLLEAISLSTQLGHRVALTECYRRLAEVHLSMGDSTQADDCGRRALDIAQKLGSRVHIGNAHRILGEALGAMAPAAPATEQAAEHFRKAVEILAGMRNELDLARCYRAYAAFREATGEQADARQLRQRADEIYGRLRGAANTE